MILELIDLRKESPHKESTYSTHGVAQRHRTPSLHLCGIFADLDAMRAVKFGDAPWYYVVNGCAMTLRAYDLRTRRSRNAVEGRLAPT